MSEGEAKVVERKPRKPRAEPAIKAGAPGEREKRTMFVREARKSLARRHSAIEGEQAKQSAAASAEVAKIESRVNALQGQIDQLVIALEAEGLPDIIKKTLEKQKADLETKRDVEQALLEAERAKPPAERKSIKIDEKEHEGMLQGLEWEMKRVVSEEESFELLLRSMQTDYGTWQQDGARRLGPYIEKMYLEPGAVEKNVLRTYAEDPEALPKKLKESVERQITDLIAKRAEAEIPAAITDGALRATLRDALVQQYGTTEGRHQVVEGYLAGRAAEGRQPMVDLADPEATMIALREAVFAKGTLDIREARRALGLLTNRENISRRLTDQEVNLVARRGMYGEGNFSNDERSLIATSRLDELAPIAERFAERLIEQENKAGQAEKAFSTLEDKFKKLAGVDWPKKIDEQLKQEGHNALASERELLAKETEQLRQLNAAKAAASLRLGEVDARLDMLATESPGDIALSALKRTAEQLHGAHIYTDSPLKEIDTIRRRIMDARSPDISGYETLRQLTRWKQDLEQMKLAAAQYSQSGIAPSMFISRVSKLYRLGEVSADTPVIEEKIERSAGNARVEYDKLRRPAADKVLSDCEAQAKSMRDFSEAYQDTYRKLYRAVSGSIDAVMNELVEIRKTKAEQERALKEAQAQLVARKASYNPFGREAQVAALQVKVEAAESDLAKLKKKETANAKRFEELEQLKKTI